MRPTVEMYDQAIDALKRARQQTIDGEETMGCSICGDAHAVFECGHNPLLAMIVCKNVTETAGKLHEMLHVMAGFSTYMGESVGVARIKAPEPKAAEPECCCGETDDAWRLCEVHGPARNQCAGCQEGLEEYCHAGGGSESTALDLAIEDNEQ